MVQYTNKGWVKFYERKLKMEHLSLSQFASKLNQEQLIKELSSKNSNHGYHTQLLLLMYFQDWKLNTEQKYIFNGGLTEIIHFCAGMNCALVGNTGDTKFDYFMENATLEDGSKITVRSIVENLINKNLLNYEIQYLILRSIDMKWLSKKVINK